MSLCGDPGCVFECPANCKSESLEVECDDEAAAEDAKGKMSWGVDKGKEADHAKDEPVGF